MKQSEVAQLLAVIAATDNRTVGRLDVTTWAEILPDDLPLAAAQAAVIQHRRTSTEWLQPKHVTDIVRETRRERLQRAGDAPIPSGLTQRQERTWRQLWCAYVKDGDDGKTAARQVNAGMGIAEPRIIPPPFDLKAAVRELVQSPKSVS